MLSNRQQQCLHGIGVRLWQERKSVQAKPIATDPVVIDPVTIDPIAEPADVALTAAPVTQLVEPGTFPSVGKVQAPAIDNTVPVVEHAKHLREFIIPPLDSWQAINETIHACTACELSENCTQKVPGVGNREADLLIVGEGPGQDEDIRGEPFVGRSGQLLDRMLRAIGIERDQVYITNIVKCRPPNNRDPKSDESRHCRVYLDAQIKQIAPKVILSVGRVSAHNLLGSNLPVGKLIKQMHQLPGTEIPVKVTYHPAYLLRTPSAKAIAWQDMKLLHSLLQ